MRALAAVLLLSTTAAPGATLGRLADGVASEIARVSAGHPVELAPIEDRTGEGIGGDLESLVRARLEGHVALTTAGARSMVTSVVAQVGTRLVWSARVTDTSSGALMDVVSVAMPWDPAVLPLVPRRGAATEGLDVLDRAITPPIEGRIVALAFAGGERLLVLFDDALALYRRDGLALRLESRRDLAGPLAPVRFPGGLLLAKEGESACWALTSRTAGAVLFSVDGSRLTPTHQADALPWPRAAGGVRFRAGTNLLDVSFPGIEAPLVAMEPEEGWVVAADGALSRAGVPGASTPRRAGPAVARLWPDLIAAAAADAPGEHDRILLVRGRDSTEVGTLAVDGAVRALAARRQGSGAVLAAALEERMGGFRIALFELGERK